MKELSKQIPSIWWFQANRQVLDFFLDQRDWHAPDGRSIRMIIEDSVEKIDQIISYIGRTSTVSDLEGLQEIVVANEAIVATFRSDYMSQRG